MLELRDYQRRGLAQLHARMAAGARRVVLVLPTGAGKTVLACYPIASAVARGHRALFVAPYLTLVDQARAKLLEYGLPRVGVIRAADRRTDPLAPVQVASWDTLVHRELPPADLVVVDEVHLAMSAERRRVLDAYRDRGAWQLLLTATPWPAGGLRPVADELLVVATVRELVAEGWLVAPRVFTCAPERRPDLKGVRVAGDDYVLAQLEERVLEPRIVGNVVDHWLERAGGRRTVVYGASRAHSRALAAEFVARGIAAEHLEGATPIEKRRAVLGDRETGQLGRLQTGETLVVCNCRVLTTGWDDPSVEVEVQAAPTEGLTLYLQEAGRIMRPAPGKQALLLDPVGNYERHGLPQAAREMTLDGLTRRQQRALVAPPRTCPPPCYAVYDAGLSACPACGARAAADAQRAKKAPRQVDGRLVEATEDVARGACELERLSHLRKLIYVARKNGLGPGWVERSFRKRFGVDVPADELGRIAGMTRRQHA